MLQRAVVRGAGPVNGEGPPRQKVRKLFEGMGLGLDSGWYSAASVKDRDTVLVAYCLILRGRFVKGRRLRSARMRGLLQGSSLSGGGLDDQLLVAIFPPAALRCLLVMGKVDDH
jgi:hypothetical protein